MRNNLRPLGYYALAKNKSSYYESTVRPITSFAHYAIGFIGHKFTVAYSFFYPSVEEKLEVKYMAWLDTDKKVHRYSRTDKPIVALPGDTVSGSGIINED